MRYVAFEPYTTCLAVHGGMVYIGPLRTLFLGLALFTAVSRCTINNGCAVVEQVRVRDRVEL